MGLDRLVSEDNRAPLYRLRRHHMQRLLKANGVSFNHETASALDLAKLIEGNGIDITKPLPSGEQLLRQILVKDEKGNTRVELYPEEKDHATKGKNIDYDAIIKRNAELNSEGDELKNENADLRRQLDELRAQQNKPVDPTEMPMSQLRAYAKSKGLKIGLVTTKTAILEALSKVSE